jgi:branched-chain amino acid transport system ATP-binding protein
MRKDNGMGNEVLLRVERIGKRFGGVQAVHDVSFEVRAGQIKSIIGPNGEGKTTLFNLLSGIIEPDAGNVVLGERIERKDCHRIACRGMSRTFKPCSRLRG